MRIYDKEKIGRFIAWGSDHLVYEYGSDKVIKFSIIFFLMGRWAIHKAERDYALCTKYFGDFLLETDLEISPNKRHLVHVQQKISGHPLRLPDLQHPEIRKQLKEFLTRYDAMCAAGYGELDLVGQSGMIKRELSNIFVTDTGGLKVIDAMILELSFTGILKPVYWLIKIAVVWRQNANLRIFRTYLV